MKLLLLSLAGLMTGLAWSQNASNAELGHLMIDYEVRAKAVEEATAAKINALNKNYAAALERQQQQAQQAGKFEDAMASRKAREQVQAGKEVPETDAANTPESLKGLRTTYRVSLKPLLDERSKNLQAVKDFISAKLDLLRVNLTKQGKLDEAQIVTDKMAALGPATTKPEAKNPTPAAVSAASTKGTQNPTDAAKERPFVNSLGMPFVPVPSTKVLFCIHETRKKDYATYAGENSAVDDNWQHAEYSSVAVSSGDDHPVVMINWEEANAFCAWLSKKEGRTYRLPTDLEWSMAVGIGREESKTDTPEERYNKSKPRGEYPWGKHWPPPEGAGNLPDSAWKAAFPAQQSIDGYTDGFATTSPVMSFKPSALGIYDLSGNVSEWCFDWRDAKKDRRTARGGSWFFYSQEGFLSCARGGIPPEQRRPYYGFRCVVEIK